MRKYNNKSTMPTLSAYLSTTPMSLPEPTSAPIPSYEPVSSQQPIPDSAIDKLNAVRIFATGDGGDATLMAKPIFRVPEDTCDDSSRVSFKPYQNGDDYRDEDITQAMIIRTSGYGDAMRASTKGKDLPTNNAIFYHALDTCDMVTAARVNYLMNNALNILIRDIGVVVFNTLAQAKYQNISQDMVTNIISKVMEMLQNELFELTANLNNVTKFNYGKDPEILHTIKVYSINNIAKCEKSLSDTDAMAIAAHSAALLDIHANSTLAWVVNKVYNVLYRAFISVFDADDMQELADALTPAFIGFRNTTVDIYRNVMIEVTGGANMQINPIKLYVGYGEDDE